MEPVSFDAVADDLGGGDAVGGCEVAGGEGGDGDDPVGAVDEIRLGGGEGGCSMVRADRSPRTTTGTRCCGGSWR